MELRHEVESMIVSDCGCFAMGRENKLNFNFPFLSFPSGVVLK